jgi:hypothetical protein
MSRMVFRSGFIFLLLKVKLLVSASHVWAHRISGVKLYAFVTSALDIRNHFQGRADLPSGKTADTNGMEARCDKEPFWIQLRKEQF